MRKTTIKPLFRMSFPELEQMGDKFVLLIDRDATELATFGVNAATKTFIVTKTAELKHFVSDKSLKADVSIARDERDVTAEEVRVSIREIMSRAQDAYGLKSAKYRKFGTSGLARKNDNKLKECAKLVVKVSGQYLSELAEQGLTQAMIDALDALIDTFDTKIMAKIEAERSRDLATENRIILANTLFKKIMSVSNSGKTHWASRSQSKYRNYVVYDKKAKAAETEAKKDAEKNKSKSKAKQDKPG